MNRINIARTTENRSLIWGKKASTLVFAAVLIVVSVTVGCSSDKPKPVTSNNQIPATQPQAQQIQPMSTPAMQAESKPASRKSAQHKKPATVNYTDKTYGVTFEYPRRYAIETGNAVTELLMSNPIAMNFVEPGGVALAAVELPENGFVNTDFSSAFFNVSVHKNLTADQCSEFAVPQPKGEAKVESTAPSTNAGKQDSTPKPSVQPGPATETKASIEPASNSKLMIGDMELRAAEAVSGEGTRQTDSKYFHVYQNGACYEFALNVTTDAEAEGLVKHVDRDKVFNRLEQILATVKINPVTPEVTAETPSTAAPQASAQ